MSDSSMPDFKPEAQTKKSIATHPKFVDMVIEGIQNQNDRKGASFVDIKKFIAYKYKTVRMNLMKSNVRRAITKGMATGIIIRPKASAEAKGITERFKVDKKMLGAMNKPKKQKVKKIVVNRNTPKTKAKPSSVETKAEPAGAKKPERKLPKKQQKRKLRLAGRRVAGKPAAIAGKPAAIAGKPAAIAGKPAAIAGKPASIAGKPASIAGKPAAIAGKPAAIAGKPAAIAGKPAGKPAAIAGKPAAIAGKPAAIAGKPAAIAGKPVAIAGKPAPIAGKTSEECKQ